MNKITGPNVVGVSLDFRRWRIVPVVGAGNGLTSSGVTDRYTGVVRLVCRLFASSRLVVYRHHCLVGTYVVQSSHAGGDGYT
jgi:hypothetical protein